MLRNCSGPVRACSFSDVLNEVLSLNAQESASTRTPECGRYVLNEVLSLNAQESPMTLLGLTRRFLLNEVLSLNAQEWV